MSDFGRRFVQALTVGLFLTALAVGASQVPGWIEHVAPIVIVKPPFESDGLRALVVMDEDGRKDMTSKQIAAFEGKDVIDWTSENAKQFIVLDKGADKGNLAKSWLKDAWASYEEKSNGKLPWVVISNGKTGTSEAYPDSPEAALALLSKYGGKQ